MTIDRPQDYSDDLSAWGRFKGWNTNHPRLSRTLWFLLLIAVIGLVLWAAWPQQQRGGPGGRGGRGGFGQAQPVGVAKATRGDINVVVNALGTVTPLATATVRPQVSGMLLSLNFTEGQMVNQGDVLAQIDPRTYQATLDQSQGQLARDQATLANQKVDLTRYQQLAQQNAISQQQLATQEALVRSTTATIQIDQANVENARINLGYTRVISPITGRVGLHLVDVGNIVSNGQSNGIVVVTKLDPMSVLFTVPEDNVDEIMAQTAQGQTLSVDAYDRTQTVKLSTGTLATVDNVIDPTTGSVKLRAMFDNKDGKFFPSQFVNVHLLVNTLHNQIYVPAPAIQRGADGTFVFVVTPDRVAVQRDVKTGIQDGDKVQITSGLQEGDTVVIDGAERLRDGAEVEMPNAKGVIAPVSPGTSTSARSRNGGAGGRRGAFNPAMMAAMNAACADDEKKLCASAGAPGSPEARRCLGQNRDSLSQKCTDGMAALRGRRGNRQQGGLAGLFGGGGGGGRGFGGGGGGGGPGGGGAP